MQSIVFIIIILVVPLTFIRDIAETETGFNFDQEFHIINIDDKNFFI